jgi:hypothetical protein
VEDDEKLACQRQSAQFAAGMRRRSWGTTGARMERKILTLESKKGRGRWREEER